MKNKKKKKLPKTESVIRAFQDTGKKTDPEGSYTGTPVDKQVQPIQDADGFLNCFCIFYGLFFLFSFGVLFYGISKGSKLFS